MMKTQCEKVLSRLKKGPITQAIAYRMGIYRLASRVYDLKKQGYDIETTIKSKHGKTLASYKLKQGK